MKNENSLIPVERIHELILTIRDKQVILDKDLALLYDVKTKELNKAINRNLKRFPEDFMIRLTYQEVRNLRFHFGTSRWGGLRYLPRAFTEQGVAMLSSVLRSERAIAANIEIMRAFVRLKNLISFDNKLARRLDNLEKQYDIKFKAIFEAIRQLMIPPKKSKRKIGFKIDK